MTGFILGLALLTYCAILYNGIARGSPVNPGGLFWLVLLFALVAVSLADLSGLLLRAALRT